MLRFCIAFIAMAICSDVRAEVALNELDGFEPRGVVKPVDQATLAIEFSAAVQKIYYREGQSFQKGDRLIEFDCRRQRAELASAEAQHREMELTLQSNIYLSKRGALGEHDMEISKARVSKAAAEAEVLRLRLEQCQIVAPFAGSIVELGVHQFELPEPGKSFLSIMKSGSPQIELIVPSNWLVWLRKGKRFQFQIEETEKNYAAAVDRIATAVDPVSQTVKIYGVFDNPDGVLAGMSGTALFARKGE